MPAATRGGLAGFLCRFSVWWVKNLPTNDDSLDVFAVHGVGSVVGWTAVATFVIIKVPKPMTGLRVDTGTEIEGLDINAHGERGCHEFG